MSGPAAARLSDGRLHFQHGPIDLILEAIGAEDEVTAAYRQAWVAFRPVLDDLAAVLPLLRKPVADLDLGEAVGRGPTLRAIRRVGPRTTLSTPTIDPASPAAAMIAAAARHLPAFVTPMAAVAGAVADHVLAATTAGRRLDRAWVNNGGDAAFWLASGEQITAAGGPDLSDRIRVTADSPVRGIATSGWRGRSHSLGIADAVTVLARSAAEADVAATLIANAVDLPGHAAITRRPARALAPDSDLGDRPVTTGVGPLSPAETARALAAGHDAAARMIEAGLIEGAALWLGGDCRTLSCAPLA